MVVLLEDAGVSAGLVRMPRALFRVARLPSLGNSGIETFLMGLYPDGR